MEQISGDTANLFRLGHDWLKKYGLIIDLRSKAERGDTLAQAAWAFRNEIPSKGLKQLPKSVRAQLLKARRAETVTLDPASSVRQAYDLCANDCQIGRASCRERVCTYV